MNRTAGARTAPEAMTEGMPEGGEALEHLIGYNLKRAYVMVRDDFRATLGEGGLSPRAFSALSLVVDLPGITQSDLARRLGVERSGMVAIADDLETRGLIVRAPVPGDRRVQALQPTGAGQAEFARLLARVEQHEARLFSVLTDAERDTLLSILHKLRQAGAG